jgi:hypothetical protein
VESYRAALGEITAHDPLLKSRLHRKAGRCRQIQRQYEAAAKAYDAAEAALGPTATVERHREWLSLQAARLSLLYWHGPVTAMTELLEATGPVLERYGTRDQRANFFVAQGRVRLRRDRFVVSDETLEWMKRAVAANRRAGAPPRLELAGGPVEAEFQLGFCYLWRGELARADELMRSALASAERTGDVTLQARCMTYLTLALRKRGEAVEETRASALRSLKVAERAKMLEYVAMAKANLAWVAWRQGDLSQAERSAEAALIQWADIPVFRHQYAFSWAAVWPLIGLTLARGQTARSVEHAAVLVDPALQPPPAELGVLIGEALREKARGSLDGAVARLKRAAGMAKPLGYL